MAGANERRVALVIGNSVYRHADTLRNPVNDAKTIAAALTRLGFTGTKPRLNLDYDGLRKALQDFAHEADKSDMAVIYFAGHGIEVGGLNYLIPTDAELKHSRDVDYETTTLDQALNAVGGARQLRLIILDACRNNPFRARMMRDSGGTRSVGQGLRQIEPGNNVLVAYAAKHGTFALDGKGDNSLFAKALSDHIEKPGLEIAQLFREVRDDVLERTVNEQEPHIYGTLGREGIYLKGPVPVTEPAKPVLPEVAGTSAIAGETTPNGMHPLLLASIAGLGAAGLVLVVSQFIPSDVSQCSSADWSAIKETASLRALQNFAVDCQHSTYSILASEELEKQDKADWAQVEKMRTLNAYRGYVDRWKDQPAYQGKYLTRAEQAVDDLAFDKSKRLGTKAAIMDYMSRYPKGRNVEAARSELTRLGFVEVAVGAAKEKRWIEAGGGKKDGESFKDCANCPEMVVVPAGNFMMGSPQNEKGRGSDESPRHKVTIAKPFAVGKFEMTFAEWDACVNDGGCKYKPDDQGWGRRDRPVINVSWDDITEEYLPWLQKVTGKDYRLPTEAEWEYAARAGTRGRFSFAGGEADICQYANHADRSTDYSWKNASCSDGVGKQTAKVGSFKTNDWGLYDVYGNVWEWVQDCYIDSYKNAPSDGSTASATSDCRRVLRGGSWYVSPQVLRSAVRSRSTADNRYDGIGFRVARTLNHKS